MYGLTGGGVDVAVIDTGVNRVSGLNGNATVIDGPDLSFDALEDNLRHRDLYGHGTNMAGIIAADNSTSGDGIAPGSHVVNVKVGAGDGTVDVSQVIAAIDWVVQHRDINGHNIRVISLSYATDAEQDYRLDPLSHAVQNAWDHGIVVVAAGGNDGRGIAAPRQPGAEPVRDRRRQRPTGPPQRVEDAGQLLDRRRSPQPRPRRPRHAHHELAR